MNEFDELYNQYFGNNKKKENNVNDRMNRIINLMNKLNGIDGFSGMRPDEEKLGEPTKTTTFERDGIIFEESTWETDLGTIVRITTKEEVEFTPDFFKNNNIPFGKSNKKEEPVSNGVKKATTVYASESDDDGMAEAQAFSNKAVECKEEKSKKGSENDEKGQGESGKNYKSDDEDDDREWY